MFLNSLGSAAVENIHFALCLDSLSTLNEISDNTNNNNKLYLHMNEYIRQNNDSAGKFFKVS